MSFQLAKAYVEFSQKGMGGLLGGIGGLASKLKSLVSPMGLVTSGLAALGAGAGVGGILKLYATQEEAEKRLEQVVRATGAAAGFSAAELKKMAGDLQEVTRFGDETTLQAQAMLLTFKSLKGDIFRDTLETAMDLSTVFGQDINGSVAQLGKALEDPLRGLTALRRVGVSFSKQQEDTIKRLIETNQLAKAQRLILDAIAGQVGGSARAAANTFAGQWEQAKNAVGDVFEEIGKILVDTFDLTALAGSIRSLAGTFQEYAPQIKATMQSIGEELKSVGGLMLEVGSKAVEGWGMASDAIGGFLGSLGASSSGVTGWFSDLVDNLHFALANWDIFSQLIGEYTYQAYSNMAERIRVFFVNAGELASWFAGNWREILLTTADYAATVFINLGQKIQGMWQAVLDFFKGRTVDWAAALDFSGLAKGYHNSIKQLPKLTEAEVSKGNKAIERLMEELGKRDAEWRQRKAGKDAAATGEETGVDMPTPGATGATAPAAAATGGGDKFKFYGLAAFADQMQQQAAKQAESRQAMDLQRQQADATNRLVDAATSGGLKVTVTNPGDLQPAY